MKISNNTIGLADEMWLSVTECQNLTVSQNAFGTFGRMDFKSTSNTPECSFRHNLVAESLNSCFDFGHGHCSSKNTTVKCECESSWPRRLFRIGTEDGQLDEFKCLVNETVQACSNITLIKASNFKENVCNRNKHSADCINYPTKINETDFPNNEDGKGYQTNGTGFKKHEDNKKHVIDMKYILIAGSVVILAVLLIAVVTISKRLSKNNGDDDDDNAFYANLRRVARSRY